MSRNCPPLQRFRSSREAVCCSGDASLHGDFLFVCFVFVHVLMISCTMAIIITYSGGIISNKRAQRSTLRSAAQSPRRFRTYVFTPPKVNGFTHLNDFCAHAMNPWRALCWQGTARTAAATCPAQRRWDMRVQIFDCFFSFFIGFSSVFRWFSTQTREIVGVHQEHALSER